MPELLVPGPVSDPFREHYRELIVSSLQRSAREQSTFYREHHRRRRAARYERAVALLDGAAPVVAEAAPPAPPVLVAATRAVESPTPAPAPVPVVVPVLVGEVGFGPTLRRAVAAVWLLTLATLAVNIAVLGFRSWATGAADLGLIALTLVWLAIASEDAGELAGSRS